MKTGWTGNLILVVLGLVSTINASVANDKLQVKVNRWIEVRRTTGQVMYTRGQKSQPARKGIRLQSVGDTIITGSGSSAELAIDIGTGTIKVSENTNIKISKLQTGNKGERITELQVNSGQVRLQMRPLTNSASRVNIKTPAGIAGVRGTTFGVSVQEDGKMGVGTKEGSVATNAQGRTVLVNGGFQNLTIPGKPPSAAIPLREDTRLNISQLAANGNQVRVIGIIDPVNLLIISQQPQSVDANGKFDINVPLPPNRRVRAMVVTPLGKQQLYELAVP
ncbi:FecR domain-containing protein [Anabaena sp. UHCC 0253]|uniref:FecR family protein n=1 Tax=Anabaena sp. UHCC 0253 TaxID=2590019 RepID=UPI0014451012|nr:FecR family protein [Anabaena sp. UHCC 0253]MTJ55185.1 FecR domain-containing protein [Anabaena sp. UHCC 0253]